MAITKEKKKEILSKLIENLKNNKIAILIEYKGTNVEQITNLRKGMLDKEMQMMVAKKTLIQKALENIGINIDLKSVKKPLALVFAQNEFDSAKYIYNQSKTIQTISLFGAIFEGKILDTKDILLFATMPSKEESLAKLLYLFTYPIRGFMIAINEIAKKNQ